MRCNTVRCVWFWGLTSVELLIASLAGFGRQGKVFWTRLMGFHEESGGLIICKKFCRSQKGLYFRILGRMFFEKPIASGRLAALISRRSSSFAHLPRASLDTLTLVRRACARRAKVAGTWAETLDHQEQLQ